MPKPALHRIVLAPVSQSDVLNITLKLKPKTNSGCDCTSTKLLRATINEILEPLTHVINISFETGRVPNNLKIAKFIPIYKSADKTLLKNYRPICLLPAFSKVIEKLTSFLNANNLFFKHQYGFWENHSTVHPIKLFIHILNKSS